MPTSRFFATPRVPESPSRLSQPPTSGLDPPEPCLFVLDFLTTVHCSLLSNCPLDPFRDRFSTRPLYRPQDRCFSHHLLLPFQDGRHHKPDLRRVPRRQASSVRGRTIVSNLQI